MNFFLFHLDYYYLILVVPAMILALIAQIGVKRAYAKYAQVRVTSGMSFFTSRSERVPKIF